MDKVVRYSLAVALTALLFVSVAYEHWQKRPYIVTGHGYVNDTFTIEYTVPGGGTGVRRFDTDDSESLVCYFNNVEIGSPLPDCARSDKAAYTEYGPE